METQRIALFGANTPIGERIMTEALERGHKVTAIVTDPKQVSRTHPNLKVVAGTVTNMNDIGSKIKGHDVVISAYEAKANPLEHVTGTRSLITAVNNDNIRQLIVCGHPGLSEAEPGFRTPENTEAWKQVAEAQRKTLELLEEKASTRWSYVHFPEVSKDPGKSGKPEASSRILVKNQESEQYFPVREYSKAVLEEAEHLISEEHTEL